jgi:hypothetical protein
MNHPRRLVHSEARWQLQLAEVHRRVSLCPGIARGTFIVPFGKIYAIRNGQWLMPEPAPHSPAEQCYALAA